MKPTRSSPIPVSADVTANQAWIEHIFADTKDVTTQSMTFGEQDVLLLYCEGLCNVQKINELVIPALEKAFSSSEPEQPAEDRLTPLMHFARVSVDNDLNHIPAHVFRGDLVVFVNGIGNAYAIGLSDPPKRTPEESNTDFTIYGARDGFVEDLADNVALIRKRLRTVSLAYEPYVIGRRSESKIGLIYITDVIQPKILQEIRKRIAKIDIDGAAGINYLEELLSAKPYSLLPSFQKTGRPDYAAELLMQGHFVILMDGSPVAIVAPVNLLMLLDTAEDYNFPYFYVTFQKLLRVLGLAVSLLLPGFYVAITLFHQDQIPSTLLATLVTSRQGVPFPTSLEAIMMLIIFELFREAGLRLPSSIGSTLSVVGGIIIGDAAIQAGLASPSMLAVIGTTAIATFLVANLGFVGAVSIARLFILIVSSMLGVFGFLLSFFTLLIYTANIRSFGVPYLSPFSPVSFQDLMVSAVRIPFPAIKRRAKRLSPQDDTRKGEEP